MPVSTAAELSSAPAIHQHDSPTAADRCNLWLTLRTKSTGTTSRVSLTRDEPAIFLHLRASGLLLGLPDEDRSLLDGEARDATVRLQTTDALGLGLAPSDFEHGVGLCGGAEDGSLTGWRCRDARVIGVDADGREHPLLGPESLEAWLG